MLQHLKNIFHDGELEVQVVVSKMEITTPHGEVDGKTQTMEAKFFVSILTYLARQILIIVYKIFTISGLVNFILGFVQLSIGRGLLKGMIDKDESSNEIRRV